MKANAELTGFGGTGSQGFSGKNVLTGDQAPNTNCADTVVCQSCLPVPAVGARAAGERQKPRPSSRNQLTPQAHPRAAAMAATSASKGWAVEGGESGDGMVRTWLHQLHGGRTRVCTAKGRAHLMCDRI